MKTKVKTPQRHSTSDGRTIYALCIEVFPGFFGNVYIIDDGPALTLVDTGSGLDASNEELVSAFASIQETFGRKIQLSDIEVILITHGHMDHFGGLAFLREHTPAPVGVHRLDRRILSHYEERVVVASQRLDVFLKSCGLSEAKRAGLLQMYQVAKVRYASMPVDFLLTEAQPVVAPLEKGDVDLGLEVVHVPGHAPGLVCLRAGDILLTGDHILERITPHQSPESITLNMGLGHYFDSLEKVARLQGVRIGLGGHESPIDNVAQRSEAIAESHRARLDQVAELCSSPASILDVSKGLFGSLHGYNVLLGIEEAGAHVEYLYLHGDLVAANLDEIESGETTVLYQRAT